MQGRQINTKRPQSSRAAYCGSTHVGFRPIILQQLFLTNVKRTLDENSFTGTMACWPADRRCSVQR